MVPSKVTSSLQLAASYFITNWASDQNNYRTAVMMAVEATTVVMDGASNWQPQKWQYDFLLSLRNGVSVVVYAPNYVLM